MALFNVMSIGSTTGYSTVDYTTWPVFAPLFMIMLSGMATSAGSTGAGIKMARMRHPAQAGPARDVAHHAPARGQPGDLGGQVVENGTIFAVLGFMLVYGGTIIGLTMVLLLSDCRSTPRFSAMVASVNNMGPGLNEVGPAGNFQGLTDFQTWVCTLAMLLGRLEMLSFLVLFTRGYWRK
jgi:trk system potassium uptake protein